MGSDSNVVDAEWGVTVTKLANDAGAGDPQAAADLLPLVYEHLRRLARAQMSKERPDQTLQPTALVHEAYLRLNAGDGGGEPRAFRGRWHFYAAVAEAMRRILVDRARRRGRLKRGGGWQRLELDGDGLTANEPAHDLVALDEGLSLLAEHHPEKAELVKLRYFAGLTTAEAAEAIGVSLSTANRYWAYARAWLFRHVTGEFGPGPAPGARPPDPGPPPTGADGGHTRLGM